MHSIARLAVAALAAATALGLVPGTPVASGSLSASGPQCGRVVTLYDLDVEAKPASKSSARGEVAKVNVTVKRPDDQDPAGEGHQWDPPHQEPASDINVGVSFHAGNVYMYGAGVTNDKGKATVRIKIERYAPPGQVYAEVGARNVVRQDCPDIYEVGYESYEKFIKIEG